MRERERDDRRKLSDDVSRLRKYQEVIRKAIIPSEVEIEWVEINFEL